MRRRRVVLKVEGATTKAALQACQRWHYSHRLPTGKLVVFGVWEDSQFVGVVVFSRGPGPQIGMPFGLEQNQICELTRIALKEHATPVTRIVSIALRLLRRRNPGLRVVISFADPEQGHHGGIYQAGNWVFIGESHPLVHYIVGGVEIHNRTMMEAIRKERAANPDIPMIETIRRKYPGMEVTERRNTPRYKYALGLDDEMRAKIESMRQAPPARLTEKIVGGIIRSSGGSIETDAPGSQPGEGVSRPHRSNFSGDR